MTPKEAREHMEEEKAKGSLSTYLLSSVQPA
jgi:hypothetical protein